MSDQTYTRHLQACANFLSQSELSAHFGLTDGTQADEVRVFWPNGQVSFYQDLAINQTHTLSPPIQNLAFYLPIIAQ